MLIESWLAAAKEDARQRQLPELLPLLESLALSTAALRDADEARPRADEAPREPAKAPGP